MDALAIAVQAVSVMFRGGKAPTDVNINVSWLSLRTTKGPHFQISAAYGPSTKEKKA